MRARMDAVGITPADIQGARDLAKIPVLSKDALVALQREQPPFGGLLTIDSSTLPRIYLSPGPIFDPQPPPEDPAAQLAPFQYLGIGKGDRVLNTFHYHLSPAGILLDEAARACGATVIPAGPGNSDLQIMLMLSLGLSAYLGTPSFLMALLDKAEALGHGAGKLPIQKALFAAEPYTASQRQRFEGDYGMKTSSVYATADLGFIGYTRAGLQGFCIMPSLYLQICDPGTGAPLPAGATGEIVVTTFNKAYPLLRFGTGDLGALAPAPQCAGQQLLGLYGRSGEAIKVRGMFLHPNQLSAAARHFPEIRALQAVISRPGNRDVLTIRVELHDSASAAGIGEKLTALAQQAARLRVDAVEFVAAGTIEAGGRKIVDARKWD